MEYLFDNNNQITSYPKVNEVLMNYPQIAYYVNFFLKKCSGNEGMTSVMQYFIIEYILYFTLSNTNFLKRNKTKF